MSLYQDAKLATHTPVYDHAGELLYMADRAKARELIASGRVDVIGSRKRIRALQFLGPDPALMMSGSHHKRPIGLPHQNENYYNVRGCWHIDRIPVAYRPHFVAVLTERLVA